MEGSKNKGRDTISKTSHTPNFFTLSDGRKIQLRKQRRTPKILKKKPLVVGWDTETMEGGWVYLIANSDKRTLIDRDAIARKDLRILTADECLAFLTQRKYRNAINVLYNLDYDFGVIIKLLPEKNVREIAETGKTVYKNYKIAWLPRKFFRIQKDNHTYAFYDVAQFFNYKPLRTASKEFGVGEKIEMEVETLTKKEEIVEHIYDIIRYCVNDAILAKKLMEYFYAQLEKGKIPLTKPISTAYLSENYFLAKCDIPTFYDAPRFAQYYAQKSYHGGRFEIIKRGTYEGKIYNYDINSAYPFQIAHLPDLRGLRWERVEKYHNDAVLGYYTVRIEYTEKGLITPIGIKHNDKLVFPSGRFTTTITKTELEAVTQLAKVRIIEGAEAYWCENEYTENYPFKEEIYRLYTERRKLKEEKNDLEYQYKIILNSLYGKFNQIKNGKLGNLTNFIYATEITARTRMRLYEVAKEKEDAILSFATDGIVATEKLNAKTSKNLGEWELEEGDKIILIMSGIYEIYDNDEPIRMRRRGIKRKAWETTLANTLQNLHNATKIKHRIVRPIKVKEGIRRREGGATIIGAFVEEEREIDINGDTKRRWERRFESGRDVLRELHNSYPIYL